jgi:DNA-binding NarL/FixJ family response regulator
VSPVEARARFARHADLLVPDTPAERLWLALQSWLGTFLGDSAERTGELAARALANGRIFAEQPDSPVPAMAVVVLARTEQLDLATDRTEAFAAQARSRGSVLALAGASFLRANVALLRGEVARAEENARSAAGAARTGGWLGGVPMFVAVHLAALIERDDLEGAEAELARGDGGGPLRESYWGAPLLLTRGRLRLAQRRFDEAAADLTELRHKYEQAGIWNASHGVGLDLALALAARGEQDAARRSAVDELERARAWGAPSAIGAALRVRGLLESGADGIALLEEAIGVLASSPVALERVRALVDYGAALRRANRRAAARAPLHEALEAARRGGALALARRAHEELAATGERLRPLLPTGAGSLTPSERRVAELAAEGLTNRQIAQTLFLTVKTVEGHLSHVYRKLDIPSRRELGPALSE